MFLYSVTIVSKAVKNYIYKLCSNTYFMEQEFHHLKKVLSLWSDTSFCPIKSVSLRCFGYSARVSYGISKQKW